ncbi:unnamed protein product (macronuclear) [Paramecium tetraurelia]|uniref:Uncharacterized protein n=1 Tax=Paramecium tetraurelia TaxID=5888 RepID=A0C0A2_PARTE|nr:uncharacterized protein GSPATT00006072001 [Paramecium tetraurelia]CAK64219.1 unnamed protein product [Paramecium tetraurelia]|eukprot:XP_001431617.1 hypothetical protein (macronuclear) [Paramecium tetraurelia strain d4-2]
MRTSFGKKVKINNSVGKMIEQKTQELNSPPLSTQQYQVQSNDLSWLSNEIEQEVDKILKIAKPQPLKIKQNLISSGNDIREEFFVSNNNTKRNSWGLDNQQELEKNINKGNHCQFQCEIPIQKKGSKNQVQQRDSFDYNSNKNDNQDLQERNYLFQGEISFAECKNNEKKQKQKKIKQFLDASFQFQEQQNNSFEEGIFKFHKQKPSQLKDRIYEDIPSPQFYQEKTKQIQMSQDLEKPNFNANLNWKKGKNRREAKKYTQYQTQEFKHLSLSIPGFYVHEKEGELKINKLQKMQNEKTKFFQLFELTINPITFIGPLKLRSNLKLCIRFKKGYTGQVFCNQDYTETIPTNQEDGKVLENEKQLFLANNSSHITKLVCCLIKKIQNYRKLNL